jgi:NAD(P)-dependent dehydrogenase (short-subunit alcohol dehydrogenase family)
MTAADWWLSFQALAAWILPDDVPALIRGTAFLIALAAGLIACWLYAREAISRLRAEQTDMALLALPLAFFFFTYLGFIILATSIEANLHLNGRYAYPVYCSVMAVVIAASQLSAKPSAIRGLRAVLVCLACVMLAGHAMRTAIRTYADYRQGVGYASLNWVRSPTLGVSDRLPRDAVLYSNGADAIAYLLRRPARPVPMHVSLRTGKDDPQFPYQAQLAAAKAALAKGNAYVIFLKAVDWRFYMASERELVDRLQLVPVARLADGTIYRHAKAEEAQ